MQNSRAFVCLTDLTPDERGTVQSFNHKRKLRTYRAGMGGAWLTVELPATALTVANYLLLLTVELKRNPTIAPSPHPKPF